MISRDRTVQNSTMYRAQYSTIVQDPLQCNMIRMYRKRYIATGSSTTQYGVQCTIQDDRTVTNVYSLHIFGQKKNMYRVKPGLGPLLLSQHRPQTIFRGKEIFDCPIIALRSTFRVWSNIFFLRAQ